MCLLTNLSQKELSQKLNLSETTISKYKKSDQIPKKTIKKFSSIFNIEESIFLVQKDESKKPSFFQINKESDPELSEIITHASALNGIKNFITRNQEKREIFITKLKENFYKETEVFGKIKQKYLNKELTEKDFSQVEILSIGICFNQNKSQCSSCYDCKNFLTTKDFIPVLQTTITNLKDINKILTNDHKANIKELSDCISSFEILLKKLSTD